MTLAGRRAARLSAGPLAERVAEHLRQEYEANYGLLIFSSPVQVHSV